MAQRFLAAGKKLLTDCSAFPDGHSLRTPGIHRRLLAGRLWVCALIMAFHLLRPVRFSRRLVYGARAFGGVPAFIWSRHCLPISSRHLLSQRGHFQEPYGGLAGFISVVLLGSVLIGVAVMLVRRIRIQ